VETTRRSEKNKEAYTVKVVCQDADENGIGNLSDKFSTLEGQS
jgi:hypothetical protein